MKIRAVHADITTCHVDAIVNAASTAVEDVQLVARDLDIVERIKAASQ